MTVTVFSKPRCPQCDGTYRKLNDLNIPYVAIDISKPENKAAFEFVKKLGHLQAPVVLLHEGDWTDFQPTEDNTSDHWSGYRPDRIIKLADSLAQAA